MPFKKGEVPPKATPWKKGEPSPNPSGKPKGTPNRKTIAARVLEMNAIFPDTMFEKIQQLYPGIENRMTIEEMATIVMMSNAISKGDVAAFKTVMDNAYGIKTESEVTVMQPVIFDFGD